MVFNQLIIFIIINKQFIILIFIINNFNLKYIIKLELL